MLLYKDRVAVSGDEKKPKSDRTTEAGESGDNFGPIERDCAEGRRGSILVSKSLRAEKC